MRIAPGPSVNSEEDYSVTFAVLEMKLKGIYPASVLLCGRCFVTFVSPTLNDA